MTTTTKPVSIVIGTIAQNYVKAFYEAFAVPSTTQPGTYESESLCKAQQELRRRNYQQANICPTYRGFSIRYASGLDNWGLIQCEIPTMEKAIEAAQQWVSEDPEKRWVTYEDQTA